MLSHVVAVPKQLIDLLQSMYYDMYVINLERRCAHHVFSDKSGLPSFIPLWEDYVNSSKGKFLFENHLKAIQERLSCDALLRCYEQGDVSFQYDYPCIYKGKQQWVSFKVTIEPMVFHEGEEPSICATLIVQKAERNDFLRHIIIQQVFAKGDGFVLLDAENDQFAILCGTETDKKIAPGAFDSFSRVIEYYIQNYVAEEDKERARQESNLQYIMECLDRDGVHAFSCGVHTSDGRYLRKQWEYRYYDKKTKRIILRRSDVTELYMEHQRLSRELMDALKRAETDSLTGALNYRSIEQYVTQSLDDLKGYAALLFIDLDDFKLVNDRFGHQVGDEVLRRVVSIMNNVVYDIPRLVGRTGGDEFVVFLPSVQSVDAAKAYAAMICKQIQDITNHEIEFNNLSASVGIALAPRDGNDYKTLIKVADERAYEAKRSGKNRFSINTQKNS